MTAVDVSTANRFCSKCGDQFYPTIHHQKYCSDECRVAHQKEKNVALSQTDGLTKVCFMCGIEKPLINYNKQNTGQYGVQNNCKECEKQKYRIQTYGDDQTQKCEICGADFKKRGNSKKYCSEKCKRSARAIREGGTPQPNKKPIPANPIIDGTRECTSCRTVKPIDQYYFDKRYNKHYGRCDDCRKENSRTAAKRHKKRLKEKDPVAWARMRYEEQAKIASKKAEMAGKEYRPLGHGIRLQNKSIEYAYDRLAEQNAYQAFKWWFAKKTDEQVAAWYEAMGKPWLNPRMSDAERYRLKYALDPEFSISERMRRQIKKSLQRDGIAEDIRCALKRGGESNKVELLLGYTITELQTHLERQFTKKMTWEKFMQGEIHIDHVLQKKLFNLSNQEEWKACWSLPNLRPMWAKDNLAKSAKRLTLL